MHSVEEGQQKFCAEGQRIEVGSEQRPRSARGRRDATVKGRRTRTTETGCMMWVCGAVGMMGIGTAGRLSANTIVMEGRKFTRWNEIRYCGATAVVAAAATGRQSVNTAYTPEN